jgi:membrane protein implicated in regulation of membrane protease activity
MKRTKQDLQFMIQFDQANRDFLINIAMFSLTSLISTTAFVVSSFSIIYSILGLTLSSIVIFIILTLFLLAFWASTLPNVNRDIRNSKEINNQLQERLFKLYPEYKTTYH